LPEPERVEAWEGRFKNGGDVLGPQLLVGGKIKGLRMDKNSSGGKKEEGGLMTVASPENGPIMKGTICK